MCKALVFTPAPSDTKIQPGTIGSVCPAQGDSVTYGRNEHLLVISAFHFERDMSSNSAPHPLTEFSQDSSRPDRALHTFPHQKPVPLSRVAHSLHGFRSDQNEEKEFSFPGLFLRKGCDVWCQQDLKNKYTRT